MLIALLALGLSAVLSQPFAPGQGVLPSGGVNCNALQVNAHHPPVALAHAGRQ